MSGHSKWAQIKRQKGVTDIKRGQAFTKIAKAITLAVKEGGGIGDPEKNFKLRLAIEKARAINTPKENIERAIERGMGKGKGESLEEVVYEGFGPGGVAVIAEAATDNRQRTNSEVKSIFDKNGGTFGNPGSVSYLFQKKGTITIKKDGKTIDEIFLAAADFGAEDVEEAGEEVLVYTKPEDLGKVKDLLSNSLTVTNAEIIRKPFVAVTIEDKQTAQKVLSFMDKLESCEDIQRVDANFDIPDNLIESGT